MSEPATVTQIPTEDAKIVRRKVYDAIEAVYNTKKKCYGLGINGYHSDESLAKNIGCSVNLVTKVREEFFGPDEHDEPTEEIKQLQISFAEMEKMVSDALLQLSGMTKQMKDTAGHLKAQKEKLKALCEEHGWYH